MATFQLYRVKTSESASLLADRSRSAMDVVLSMIQEEPSKHLKRGQRWRIGNIELVNEYSVFFAFGKMIERKQDFFDDTRRNFFETTRDEAPYTSVALDLQYQVCAIAKKPALSQRIDYIANSLADIWNASRTPDTAHFRFVLERIDDPSEFVTLIRTARRIRRFEIALSPPNPFDVEEQFHRPMEELLSAMNASSGKMSLSGEDLDANIAEELTRSAATTGNTTKARIQSDESTRPRAVQSGGTPITIEETHFETIKEKYLLFERIRETYTRIRRSGY